MFNQGTILMLLYSLLVLPKGILDEENNMKVINGFNTFNFKKFNVTIDKTGKISDNPQEFIKYFRHAVAHVNIEIQTGENTKFIFWNYPPNCRERNFEFETDKKTLLQFITVFGKFIINNAF